MADPYRYEYTTGECEQWQVHMLCNYFADKGWEAIQMMPIDKESVQLPRTPSDENGPLGPAYRPVMVLFKRPIPNDTEDEADEIDPQEVDRG